MFRKSEASNEITLVWNNVSIDLGTFYLQDAFGGAFVNIDMITGDGFANAAFASWDGTTLSVFNTAVNTLNLKVTPTNYAPPAQTGGIQVSVMFMNYNADPSAAMIMGYAWEGATWEEAEAAGPIDSMGEMFMITPDDGMMGTVDVTFDELSSGIYYVGVFETTGMMYSTAIATVGYYNDADENNIDMMTPTAITVTSDTVVLGTMMAMSMVIDDEILIPEIFAVDIYPNPFNPTTTIEFSMPQTEFVMVKVYNIVGNEITTLINDELSIGYHSIQWDGSHQPSGVYFVKIQSIGFVQTRKMVLLK